ncbi:hypothetical protein F5051DRAFT_423926 [Lentinula edodes]|nr:hypothetical protein F5051DRAFT_423926 [Lentinula edodes]
MYRVSVLLLAFFWAISFVAAQFSFFDQMFGHQQPHQQQQPPSGGSQWASNIESGMLSLVPDIYAPRSIVSQLLTIARVLTRKMLNASYQMPMTRPLELLFVRGDQTLVYMWNG